MLITFVPWFGLKILTIVSFLDPFTRLKTVIVIAILKCLFQPRNAMKGFIFWETISYQRVNGSLGKHFAVYSAVLFGEEGYSEKSVSECNQETIP